MSEQLVVYRAAFTAISDSSEHIDNDFTTWIRLRNATIGYTLEPGGRVVLGLDTLDIVRVTNPSSATDNLDSFLNLTLYLWFGYLDRLTLSVTGGNAAGVISGDYVTRHIE